MLTRAIRNQAKQISRIPEPRIAGISRVNQTHPSIYFKTTIRPLTTTARSMTEKVASASVPSSAPGENFEVRQTHPQEDYAPDPSKSLKLSPARQALVDDILALYCCKPTVERVKRYTPDCTYDDQFVYANDRYKMAAQWFALPKLFSLSTTNLLQIVTDEPGLIQWKYEQVRPSLSQSSSPYTPFPFLKTRCLYTNYT